jgi:hypothetical protein
MEISESGSVPEEVELIEPARANRSSDVQRPKSNVHFGIAGLEAATLDEPEPAPARSNVHFGIAGLEAAILEEEISDEPLPSSRASNVHFGTPGPTRPRSSRACVPVI